MSKKDELKRAEAMGVIRTLPEQPVLLEEEIPDQSIDVIDNPEDFRAAVGNAALDGREYIEVTPKMFKYLVKNAQGPKYITYGDHGIRVYQKGERENIEKLEKMSADQYHDFITKEKSKNAQVE